MVIKLTWMICLAALTLAAGVGGQPPATPAPTPRDDAPLPAHKASDVPPNIVWGPGRDVQAGLALVNRYGGGNTGLYVFGVYLRNRTKQTLTITCPSFQGLSVPGDDTDYSTLIQSHSIYCTPHLRDSKGKPVEVGFKLGTENSQYTVGPGQVAYVSHWMLRTIDRQKKGTDNAKFTQVAFVDPGKYRMACDVSAAWGGSKRISLRTGEVAIEVTGADLAR